MLKQAVARSADPSAVDRGASERHRPENCPGQQESAAENQNDRGARTARDIGRGTSSAVEMAKIVLLPGHGNRMG